MTDTAMDCVVATDSFTQVGVNSRLTLQDIQSFVTKTIPVRLSPQSHTAMERSYQFLKRCIDERMPIYGLNTQFGDQVDLIEPYLKNSASDINTYYHNITARQMNLIRSFSCGLGNVVSEEIVKVAMLLRAHCLAQGYSGVNPKTVETLLAYVNAGITPIVRCYGSIGASGDLIPLAMIAAGMLGEDVDVKYRGEIMRAPQALELSQLSKLQPTLRDGLALINGTSFMTAIASLSGYKLKRLFKQMLSAIAMCLESMFVINSSYNPLVHQLKNHTGENIVNQFLLNFWKGSLLVTDLDKLRDKNVNVEHTVKPIQDYYSLRSVAQGFGPFKENLDRAIVWIENEMNSVNDNPIIDVTTRKIHHNANFMGFYITDACDILKMDIAQASSWLHALLANMVHPRKNQGLPTNLVEDPYTQNGFKSLQLLAASIAVQNRKLAQSHQAYALPTEGDNQDVNSLGTHAAFDLKESVANLERLTAIMLLAATQALEFRGIEKASDKSKNIYEIVRTYVPPIANCRPLTEQIHLLISVLEEEKI